MSHIVTGCECQLDFNKGLLLLLFTIILCSTVVEPEHWSSSDVCRWLNWLLQQYSSTSCDVRDDEWSLTGAQLCQLSVADVHDRFPRVGGFVLAELQLWKNFGPLGNLVLVLSTLSSGSL